MHTVHCTLYITHYTLHSTHCTLCIALCTLHTTHRTLHTALYTLHTEHHTLHAVHCTLHTAYCTPNTAHYTLHTAHCSVLPCAQRSVPPPVQDERKLPEAEPWENRSRLPPLPHYYQPRLEDLLYKLWENWFPTGHKIQIWVSPQNKKWRQTWGTIYIPMVGLYLLLVVSHSCRVKITMLRLPANIEIQGWTKLLGWKQNWIIWRHLLRQFHTFCYPTAIGWTDIFQQWLWPSNAGELGVWSALVNESCRNIHSFATPFQREA